MDAAGRYYTEYGHTGLLREMNYLENAPQRVSYVSNSLTVDDSRMVFLEQLSTPITLQSGEKEISLQRSIVQIIALYIHLVPVVVDHILQTVEHLVGDLFHLAQPGRHSMELNKTDRRYWM